MVLLLANIVVRDRSTRALYQHTTAVAHTHAVISALDRVLTRAVDAETGERGFLITGRDDYLEPYYASSAALDTEVTSCRRWLPTTRRSWPPWSRCARR